MPLPAPLVMPTAFSSTSVADANGNLLFASNGGAIIDRNLNLMPALANQTLLTGSGEVLIQQIPGSDRYYLFYTTQNVPGNVNSKWTLRFAIVDMALNGGNGDVTTYNQVIDTSSSPSFTLAQGNTLSEAWLVMHRYATDSFYAFNINSAGLSSTPVKSRAGTNATLSDYIFRDIKTSFDGKTIAGITYRDYTGAFAYTIGFIELYHFNAATGALTYKVRSLRKSGYFFSYLSIEFSPDNRLLYTCRATRSGSLQPCPFGSGRIEQYNTCYTDSLVFDRYSMIIASDFQFCNPQITWGTLQAGANKKIYVPYSGTTVTAINNPSRAGSTCNYVFNSFQQPNNNFGYTPAPNFHHKMMERAIKNNIIYDGGCHPAPVNFHVTNDTIASINWNFGDPASPDNTSTLLHPSHVFSAPGIYTVTAELYNSQGSLIETITEMVERKDPGRRLLYGYPADTSFCQGGSLNLHLSAVNGIFHWYQLFPNGNYSMSAVSDSIRIENSGTYYVEMRQNDCNGCIMLDSIRVTVLPKPLFTLGPDRYLCQGDSVQLTTSLTNANHTWSTGATTPAIWVHQGGLYWAEAEFNNNGCAVRDSILITEVPGINFSLPNDTTLCTGQTILLSPGVPNAYYLWQNGTTQPVFNVTQPGTYWVRVSSVYGCWHTDTIVVNYINAQQVNLGNDTTLCTGSVLPLGINLPNATYVWSTGSTANQITVTQPGSYWVEVTNGNCVQSDTINVAFAAPPVVNLGNDITLCPGGQLVLDPRVSNAVYLWQDGSTAPTFTVNQPGLYWVEVKQNSCTVRDSITVSYYAEQPLSLGPDTRFCTGDSLTLNAGPGFVQYNWSTGATTPQLVVHNAGSYWVAATNANGCTSRDTLTISPLYALPVINLGADAPLCSGNSRQLDAGPGYTQYLWNTGSNAQSIAVNSPGPYAVQVVDANGCRGSDTTRVTQLLPLPAAFLPADTAICNYGSTTLTPLTNYAQYLWSTGSRQTSISITQPGLYWLQVTDLNNCSGRDSIQVTLKECMRGVYVPSAFTPDNNGRNDLFHPLVFGNLEKYEFAVYDRAGQILYRSTTPGSGWDGRYKGIPLSSGVYVWICHYQLSGEAASTQKGTVTLMR